MRVRFFIDISQKVLGIHKLKSSEFSRKKKLLDKKKNTNPKNTNHEKHSPTQFSHSVPKLDGAEFFLKRQKTERQFLAGIKPKSNSYL